MAMKTLSKLTALCAVMALAVPAAQGQGRKSLRINEVMVDNATSVVDDYGNRSAWIEVINPTHAPVEISSIYLTDDMSVPTKYYVPRGDSRTKLGKGQTVLFRADGEGNHGTFHVNFTLKPGQDNFIAIFDADGINLIDSVTVPAALTVDCSYARTPDGDAQWQVRDNSSEELAVTPGGLNVIKGPNNKILQFKELDEDGFAMSGMAMSIVFGALLVLCLCFVLIHLLSKRAPKAAAPEAATLAPESPVDADAEVAAAIAMALHQHLNAGVGNARLTIVHNNASAWASKTQAMRQTPHK